MTKAEELEMVKRAVAGDELAWTEIHRTHADRVRKVLWGLTHGNRTLTEDLSQEAFLQIFRKLPLFQGRSRLSTWIYRLTVNTFLMWYRQQKKRHHRLPAALSFESVTCSAGIAFDPPDHPQYFPDGDLEQLLASLEPRNALIVQMRYLMGLEIQETADRMNMSVSAIKASCSRSIRNMRQLASHP